MSKELENAKFVCPICNSDNTEIEEKSHEVGFYCYSCGSWTKLSDKEDTKSYETHERKEESGLKESKELKDFLHWILKDKTHFQTYHNSQDKDQFVSDLIEVYTNGIK